MSGKDRQAPFWGLPKLTPPMEPPSKTVSLPLFLFSRLLALAAIPAFLLAVCSLGIGFGVLLDECVNPEDGLGWLAAGRVIVLGVVAWTAGVTLKAWSEWILRILMERFDRDEPNDGLPDGFVPFGRWRRSRRRKLKGEEKPGVDEDF